MTEFFAEIEAEAQAAGPDAVRDLRAKQAKYRGTAARLDIARDLLSRKAEGWDEDRIEARKQALLSQLAAQADERGQ